ncbi:MAG TPA: hypothetical protein VFG89_02915 [Coriobacteriia bacterium]|nr:hypothetical protein [Coriobacteriia bacterium]
MTDQYTDEPVQEFAEEADVLPERLQELDAAANRKLSRSRAAEWIWWGVLSFVLFLVTVAGFSAAAAVSPVFCSTCHLSAAHDLSLSPHKGISCDGCHRDTGAFGLVESRLWVAGMVIESPYRAIFPRGGETTVDRQRCINCHRRQLMITSLSNGVKMSHVAPVQDNWSCQRCHRDVAHGTKGRVLAVYTMGVCMGCHSNGQADVNSCITCHPEGVKPSARRLVPTAWNITHGPNWQKTHGMGDLTTCSTCHIKRYCVACHQIDLPHPDTYLSVHGTDYLTFGDKTCLKCHQKSSCDGCHAGIEMPHPKPFMRNHRRTVERGGKAPCMRCHDQQSCDRCHSRHTHPGVPKQLLKQLKERPVNVK